MSGDKTKHSLEEDQQSKAELLHNLQVHQIELKKQNRQLRESQQELEEARDRYADLYDFAPVGYLTLSESGVVQEINLTGAAMLGMERLNLVGQPFIHRLATSSIKPFMAHLRQIFSQPGNKMTEIFVRTKAGKPRAISLESVAMQGDKPSCRTVMHDITVQRRMSVALQISRSAQDALLHAIPALVFYLDTDLKFHHVSQAFADFIGLTPEDVFEKSLSDIFPQAVAADLQQVCSSVLLSGKAIYGFDNSMPDLAGNACYMSTMIAPFLDIQDRIIGLVGVSIDITAIKTTSNSNSDLLVQNRKLTRNLFEAQEEERRFIARELHDELGQWFTAIQAEAQVICNVAKQDPKIHDSALAISNSAKAVHGVIRGMLHKLRPSLLDELGLAESLSELQRQWCKRHPDIVCELRLDVPLAGLGEELNILIYRLIQEALNNIANHAHAHKVVVSFELEPGKNGNSDVLLLRVEDDGSGFDTKQVRSGIGLLGMRERVIAAGGDFYMDSKPGQGAIIMARLPLINTRKNK